MPIGNQLVRRMQPDLQVLPASTGLPRLPSVGITLQTARRLSSRLLERFAAHVRSVLPSL